MFTSNLSCCFKSIEKKVPSDFSLYYGTSNKAKQVTKFASMDNYSQGANGARVQGRKSGRACLRQKTTLTLMIALRTEYRFLGCR